MLSRNQIENKLKRLKPILSEKYFVVKIGYFGSYSRDEQTKNSDIDILVELSKPLGWDFFDLKEFLEMELKTKVDLVSRRALKKQLEEAILKEVNFL